MFYSSGPVERYNQEAASAPNLDHHGEEFRVDCTEVGIQSISGYPYIVITLVPFYRRPVDMSELGAEIASKTL